MKQRTVLVTGGSGFFGGILKRRLLGAECRVVSLDLRRDSLQHAGLTSIAGDIRDEALVSRICSENRFDAVYHCAAMLSHEVRERDPLWSTNVDGTRIVAEAARRSGVSNLVFLSSSCLWGPGCDHAITEDERPAPAGIYGSSKWVAERVLREYAADLNVVTLRCPAILDFGRLGLLSILFEFIGEGRRVCTVGGGHNRYQFIYSQDLVDACLAAAEHPRSDIFHIGADGVKPVRELFEYVIQRAGTGAKVSALPGKASCSRCGWRTVCGWLRSARIAARCCRKTSGSTRRRARPNWAGSRR